MSENIESKGQDSGIHFLQIPIQLVEDENVTNDEQKIFALIQYYDCTNKHCYASNDYIGCVLKLHENTVSKAINNLIKLGYLVKVSFDGRNRVIKINPEFTIVTRSLLESFNNRIENYKKQRASSKEKKNSDPIAGRTLHQSQDVHIDKRIKEEDSFLEEKNNSDSTASVASLPSAVQDTDTRFARTSVSRSSLRNPTNGIQPKKFIPSDRAKIIIDHWNSKDNLVKHKEGTKLYKEISLLIDKIYNGKVFDLKILRKDFIDSIDQFHLSATHLDYEPTKSDYKEHLKKTSLLDFLYKPTSDSDKHKSLFRFHLDNPAVLCNNGTGAVRTRKSDVPAISILSDWYKLHATNPNGNGVHHFGLAAQKLKKYKELHINEFNPSLEHWRQCHNVPDDLSMLAVFLCDAVEWDFKKNKGEIPLTAGWLSSDYTFDVRLPKYLSEQAFIYKEYRV